MWYVVIWNFGGQLQEEFCGTQSEADELVEQLRDNGIEAGWRLY